MGRIILARAGTTDFDEQDRVVGNLDVPVNIRGQAELAEIAREWAPLELTAIFSAASESARESAKFLGERLDVKVRVLDDLTNQDFGLWQGLPMDEIKRKHPRVIKQWEESPCGVCPPAGEMVDSVLERVRKALKPVVKRAQKESVALIAPDPLRQVIGCYLQQADIANLWEFASESAWQTIEVG